MILLRCDDERHWLRAAPRLVGHLFPRLPAQSEHNTRLRQIAPLMEAALRRLADASPATADLLRLMDATPVPCGTSAVTAKRSDLFGYAARQTLERQPVGEPPRARHRRRHRQEPVRAGYRGVLGRRRPGPGPDPPRPQRREAAAPVPELAPTARRGRHLDPEEQLGLERHGGRIPAGLWTRIIQRLLALNGCIWHNRLIGAPVKRSLIAYDHV